MEKVSENPNNDGSMKDFEDKRIIPVPVLNKPPSNDSWRPSQRLKIQKWRRAVESRSTCPCICSIVFSTTPNALIVETPAADGLKCSSIAEVGSASARLTVVLALI
jgi:hypothetical protein